MSATHAAAPLPPTTTVPTDWNDSTPTTPVIAGVLLSTAPSVSRRTMTVVEPVSTPQRSSPKATTLPDSATACTRPPPRHPTAR